MRLFTATLLFLASIVFFSSDCSAQTKQYVAVSAPFINVYVNLDPKSMVIGTARKGDHLELVATGDSWYKVKMGTSEGWLEKRAGDVVNNAGNSSTVAIIVVLLFVAGAFGTISYYIYKSKLGASA
jgi:hypothetical protein